MNNEAPDIVSFIIAILTFFASKEIALLISPYLGMIIASSVAAGWAISSLDRPFTGKDTLKFVGIRVLTAILFTVTIAQFIHSAVPVWAVNSLLIPVAFAIGFVKDFQELKNNALLLYRKFRGKDV